MVKSRNASYPRASMRAAPPLEVKESFAATRRVAATGTGLPTPRALYRANPVERIDLARAGVKAKGVADTARLLHISQDRLIDTLGLSRPTVARKVRDDAALDTEQSARLVGLLALVGQVEEIVAAAADVDPDTFDAGVWVAGWLEQPLPALGNVPPGEYMDCAEGQLLVSRLLAQSIAGAYV